MNVKELFSSDGSPMTLVQIRERTGMSLHEVKEEIGTLLALNVIVVYKEDYDETGERVPYSYIRK